MGKEFFHDFLYPRQVVLVTAATSEKANVTAAEWVSPVSEKPPAIALSLANSSLTLELMCASMEFVVAIPDERLKDAVLLCGTTSGKIIDKFEEGKLTPVKASRVSAPLVKEAKANLECKVLSYQSVGSHTLVVGEIIEVHGQKEEEEGHSLLFNQGGKRLFEIKA
ncbi:MAG: flavin reductase family protein [Candidatus Micrarchaeota archaeon]|nr:flavin reductase family protein [Candidatus Micrarchaeota archaeon]